MNRIQSLYVRHFALILVLMTIAMMVGRVQARRGRG